MGYYDGMGVWHDTDDWSSPYDPQPGGGSSGDSTRSGGSTPSSPSFGWTPQQTSGNESFLNYMAKNPSVAQASPADFWIPPTANYGDNPAGAINRENPFADPGRPYAQVGTTGGALARPDGTSYETIGVGRSTTPAEAQSAYDAMVREFGAERVHQYLRENPNDYARGALALRTEQAGQGASGEYSGGSGGGGGTGSGASGGDGGRGALTSPQFTGAGQNLIENYATDRFDQLTNPNAESGTALFEKLARELIDTLQGPVYSAQDESIIKGSALDSIERDRTSTKQQWLQELGRRGINPSSGIALHGIQNIDNQFNQYRTAVEAEFKRKAIDQTRQQRLQVLGTAGQLAASQEGRLDKAGTYAYMPYGLEQDAFTRNAALVGLGGSPQSTLSSALAMLNANMNADAYTNAQQQASLNGLLQFLGYRFG